MVGWEGCGGGGGYRFEEAFSARAGETMLYPRETINVEIFGAIGKSVRCTCALRRTDWLSPVSICDSLLH